MVKLRPNPETIASVSGFVRKLKQQSNSRRRLFRGQPYDEPLLPRIARLAKERGIPNAEVTEIERRMLARFRRESPPMLGSVRAETDWELLSIAQHQGMPTRLLDWTANALAALWFAVSSDPPQGQRHGVVWVMEVHPANEGRPTSRDDIFDLKRTIVFQPFHLDRRIVAQAGWFSVHRYAAPSDQFVPLEKNTRYKNDLVKFVVRRNRFRALREELRLLGVSQASMFPDLSGLGADIQAEFIDSWRPLSSI